MPIDIPPLPPGFDIPAEFPISARWDFFNHAGVAPIARRAAAELERYARESQEDAYLLGRWYKRAETVRAACAKIINASPHEIAFVKNTSEGLAFVANGLTWNAGDEIISTAVEYPANVYPWMDLVHRCGVRHLMISERDGRIDPAEILAAITPRTRMVAISHVEYASGFRNDLAALGAACRPRGILLCVDAIQSCGVVPVDVAAMNIDFLSADGHKWMLGPEGLGFFYCRNDLIAALRPEVGWMNVINALDYGNYDFTLRNDARRFECGTYNIPGVLALGAALQLLLDVGLDLVFARILALADRLCDGLKQKGYRLISSRQLAERSGIVSFASPLHDHTKIVRQLEAQKIVIVVREGRLRASPHFYNTPEQIDRLIAALPDHSLLEPAA